MGKIADDWTRSPAKLSSNHKQEKALRDGLAMALCAVRASFCLLAVCFLSYYEEPSVRFSSFIASSLSSECCRCRVTSPSVLTFADHSHSFILLSIRIYDYYYYYYYYLFSIPPTCSVYSTQTHSTSTNVWRIQLLSPQSSQENLIYQPAFCDTWDLAVTRFEIIR